MPSRFTPRFSARTASRFAAVPGWFTVLMLPAVVVVGLIAAMVSFAAMIGIGLARLVTGGVRRTESASAPAAKPSKRPSAATIIDGSWTVLAVRDPEYA